MTSQHGRPREILDAGLAELAPGLAQSRRDLLLDYVDLLVRWNRRFNLTGTRAPAEIVTRHVLDSLSVAPYLRGERALDAGSGAGLPGLVLAAALPEMKFTLMDSAAKKTRFLIQAAATLKLSNVAVERSRLEAFAPRERFDCIVSRAFESAPALLAHAGRLLAPGGRVLVMKGRYPSGELEALRRAGVEARAEPLAVPGLQAARHVVLIEPEARRAS